ncbi:hypothetical protein ACFS07_22085 [Undibacterium arcticum]
MALVLAVVIGLPMILDSEPKPLADDIAIEIPSKDKPAVPAVRRPSAASSAGLDRNEELLPSAAPSPSPSASASTKPIVPSTALVTGAAAVGAGALALTGKKPQDEIKATESRSSRDAANDTHAATKTESKNQP